MPDVITHATFALDLAKKIDNNNLRRILVDNKYIYFLGSQGPDVFYFIRLFSRKGKLSEFNNLGNIMHNNKADDFILESIKYLKDNYSEILHSYITGLICHQALDSIAHPYIYYLTGIYNVNDSNSLQYRGNHLRLERAIDSIFLKTRWYVKKPHKFKIFKKILKYNIDKVIFKPYFDNVLYNVFNKKDGGTAFIKSASNFKRYAKIIYDPIGYKKKLAKLLDKFINKSGKIVLETLFYRNNIKENIDYLNLKRKKWQHPVNKEVFESSFIDLFNDGLLNAKREVLVMMDYLDNKITFEDIKNKVSNLSYSTGIDWHEGNNMCFFKNIFLEEI